MTEFVIEEMNGIYRWRLFDNCLLAVQSSAWFFTEQDARDDIVATRKAMKSKNIQVRRIEASDG